MGAYTVHRVGEKNQNNISLFSFLQILFRNFSSVLFDDTNERKERITRETKGERRTNEKE